MMSAYKQHFNTVTTWLTAHLLERKTLSGRLLASFSEFERAYIIHVLGVCQVWPKEGKAARPKGLS